MKAFRFTSEPPFDTRTQEVRLQLDSRKAVSSFRQIDHRAEAASGIRHGDYRTAMEVAIRSQQSRANGKAGAEMARLRLNHLKSDEAGQIVPSPPAKFFRCSNGATHSQEYKLRP